MGVKRVDLLAGIRGDGAHSARRVFRDATVFSRDLQDPRQLRHHLANGARRGAVVQQPALVRGNHWRIDREQRRVEQLGRMVF